MVNCKESLRSINLVTSLWLKSLKHRMGFGQLIRLQYDHLGSGLRDLVDSKWLSKTEEHHFLIFDLA